jgi:hypothetical protein
MKAAGSIGFDRFCENAMIAFDYNPDTVAAVKEIPGRRFNKEGYFDGTRMRNFWTVPVSPDTRKALVSLAKAHNLEFYGFATVEEFEAKYAN